MKMHYIQSTSSKALCGVHVLWRTDRELEDAFDNMSVRDARGLRTALIMILHFGGKPPNWVR